MTGALVGALCAALVIPVGLLSGWNLIKAVV